MVVVIKNLSKSYLRLISMIVLCSAIFMLMYVTLKLLNMRPENKENTLSNYGAQNVDLLPNELHNLIGANRLFYGRVPKTASTTFTNLMKQMGLKLGYTYTRLTIPGNADKVFISEEQKEKLVHYVKNAKAPCSFEMLMPFIDYTKYGEIPPIFVGMIRDPVERYISSYYYWLKNYMESQLAENNKEIIGVPLDTYFKEMSLDDCILTNDSRCTLESGTNYTLTALGYYCGHERECWLFNNSWAFQTAIRNIERSYSVVGAVEYFEETLEVLEHILPQFFKGASEVYKQNDFYYNKNSWKANISAEARQILKDRLAPEYKLYDFLVKRLHDQHKNIITNS